MGEINIEKIDNFSDSIKKSMEEESKKMPSGEWLEMSKKMDINYPGDKIDQWHAPYGVEKMGKIYSINNRIIAFVNWEGKVFVGPSTPDRKQALIEARYKEGGVGVPFSNGELPVDPELRKKWEEMLKNAKEENEN